MHKLTNIAIIDDHRLFSEGLKSILERTGFYKVDCYNHSDDTVLDEIRHASPSVVIADYNMPVNNGIEVIRKLKPLTGARFIMVSVRKDTVAVKQAIRAGFVAYLFKNAEREDFLQVMQCVLKGDKHFPLLKEECISEKEVSISSRERMVLKLLCDGLSVKEVAEKLFISEYTVITHKKNLFVKTNTNSIVSLAGYAMENGLC